ncbi:MAG: hypothetical protein KF865_02975 [Bdellovibrionaceae bacterium]|nr:hypothetical protein [Pseudobdellovibrionaceae bacterium]
MIALRHASLIVVFAAGLSSCAPPMNALTERLASEAQGGAACEDFPQKITASLGQVLLDQQDLPDVESFRTRLRQNLADRPEGERLAAELGEVYEILVNEARRIPGVTDRNEWLAEVMALGLGDRTTPEKDRLQNRLDQLYARIAKNAAASGIECARSEPSDDTTMILGPEPSRHHAVVKGALKVMATAYQSCQSLRVPAMSLSSAAIEKAAIRYLSPDHPSGGKRRVIADLKALQRSHYYIREGIERDASCFNVPQNPLIYDFGGKPYATMSASSSLNFFKDSGSGTSVLGVDCSGFVYAALVSNGLRIKAGRAVIPGEVVGVGARAFMDPARNGLTCLAPVASQASGTIRNGDILASTGHVVIIDGVGADPFGVNRLAAINDCVAANVSHRNFDFDVLQSSPSKNGIGINRMKAADYLERESPSMRTALVKYAVSACKARFGRAETIAPAEARLVRHKMTAECLNPQIKLERESCVRACVSDL